MTGKNPAVYLTGESDSVCSARDVPGRCLPRRTCATALLISLTITFSILTAGCSHRQNEKAAIEAINNGLKREPIALYVFLGRVGRKCTPIVALDDDKDLTAVTNFHAAQKAGLITITPDGPDFWKVELVDPKPELVEFLKKFHYNVKDGCNDIQFNFGVATKSVSEIVQIREITAEKAEAEFKWNWKLSQAGEKLVNALSQRERVDVNGTLELVRHRLHGDPTFNLADMTFTSAPHPGKVTLKKSGEAWVLDE